MIRKFIKRFRKQTQPELDQIDSEIMDAAEKLYRLVDSRYKITGSRKILGFYIFNRLDENKIEVFDTGFSIKREFKK